jgi:glycosyltransferase involved in cell wall biosynthesis
MKGNSMAYHPLVSIITPTYNHERFIGQCIESVLAQTYPHWEQIIIDDGSTDGTGNVISRYQDERIKYIRQNNLGIWNLGKIYNNALQISRGDLIAILEGDDFWPPYKLERQIPAFARKEVVLSWGKGASTNSEGETTGISPKSLKSYMKMSRNEMLRVLLFRDPITACTVICRRSALLSIGGFKQPDRVPYVDLPTMLELALVGEFGPVDEVLGYRRSHEGQVTGMMREEMNEARKYSIEFFTKLSPQVRESLGVKLEDLLANIDYVSSAYFFYLGRKLSVEGRWEEAEKNFRKALEKGCLSTKMKAALGLIGARCRTDLERLFVLMMEPPLKERI